uniref:Steroid 21-hydroxylase n=1 Tax=Denticeps clupeoides TaxID=299321 RepID=A0AAY4CGV4_9TELE
MSVGSVGADPGGLLLLALLMLLLWWWWWKMRGTHQKAYRADRALPGPPSLPLLGNMLDLARDHLPSHLTTLARRYGNIYRLQCGSTTMVVLSSADVIREALVRKWSDFAGRPHSYTALRLPCRTRSVL